MRKIFCPASLACPGIQRIDWLFKTGMFVFLFISGSLHAQTISVNGKVSDQNGPLGGVSVKVQGMNTGAATDEDGNYKINAFRSASLVFSHLGYVSHTIVVTGNTVDVLMTGGSTGATKSRLAESKKRVTS